MAKAIAHGERVKVRGKDLDEMFEKADDFMGEMAKLVDVCIEINSK